MSRFLFTIFPTDDFGLLTRSLPIARELEIGGHEVSFCHPANGPQILIAEGGFENRLPDDPLYGVQSPSQLFRLLGRESILRILRVMAGFVKSYGLSGAAEVWNIDHFSALNANPEVIRSRVDALAEMIKSFKADAVVDFWDLCACIAARIVGKPLITVISAFQHPASPGFIWWKGPPPNIPTAVPWLNGILTQYGLPAIKSAGDVYVGDLTLVLGMPELDPLPDTAQVTYIGAVLWQNPETRPPEWLSQLGRDRPVIWIYPGKLRYAGKMRTWADSEVVLQASIEAFAKEDVQVVLSSGHQDIPPSFLPLPANFRSEPFVPGLAMAERSDLMIHHGGYGSCQTGLYVGTPQVIIPTMSERESNARRVLQQGTGEIVLPATDASGRRKKVDAADLAAKVRKVLSTPSFKENALRISAKLKGYGGAPRAAELIENFVKR